MIDSAKHEIEKYDEHKVEIINSSVNQHKNESDIKDKIISNLNEELTIKSIVKQCLRCIQRRNIEQDFAQIHKDYSKLKVLAK